MGVNLRKPYYLSGHFNCIMTHFSQLLFRFLYIQLVKVCINECRCLGCVPVLITKPHYLILPVFIAVICYLLTCWFWKVHRTGQWPDSCCVWLRSLRGEMCHIPLTVTGAKHSLETCSLVHESILHMKQSLEESKSLDKNSASVCLLICLSKK